MLTVPYQNIVENKQKKKSVFKTTPVRKEQKFYSTKMNSFFKV